MPARAIFVMKTKIKIITIYFMRIRIFKLKKKLNEINISVKIIKLLTGNTFSTRDMLTHPMHIAFSMYCMPCTNSS